MWENILLIGVYFDRCKYGTLKICAMYAVIVLYQQQQQQQHYCTFTGNRSE